MQPPSILTQGRERINFSWPDCQTPCYMPTIWRCPLCWPCLREPMLDNGRPRHLVSSTPTQQALRCTQEVETPNWAWGRWAGRRIRKHFSMRWAFSYFHHLPSSALWLLQLRTHNPFKPWPEKHRTTSATSWWDPELSRGAVSFIWLPQVFKPRRKYTCVCQGLAKCAPDWQNTKSFKKWGNCTSSTAIR